MRPVLAALSILGGASLLGIAPAAAEDQPAVVLTAGLWRFDASVLMPLAHDPQVQSLRICSTGESITPERLMAGVEDQGCTLKDARVEDGKLEWKIRCDIQGQRGRGKGEFQADSDRASGEARIKFDVAGQRMTMKLDWEGERLGDCPPPASEETASPPKSE